MRNLVLSVVGLLAAACGGQQAPLGPSNLAVRISGRVLDFESGAGVPAATVAYGAATAVTDSEGAYTVAVPIGRYEAVVDGVWAGVNRVTTSTYRGDLFVRGGNCVSRYGTVTDARTLRPLAGSTVSLAGRSVTTGIDGWYRIDLGCPVNGLFGFNTTFIYASHPRYVDLSQGVGRGVYRISRLDLELKPR